MPKKVFDVADDVRRFNRAQPIPSQNAPVRCECKSYNRPELGGTVDEVILEASAMPGGNLGTVCVDACIADHIKALWSGGVPTLGSCCGHNGALPRNVVVAPFDGEKARCILAMRGAELDVWTSCE